MKESNELKFYKKKFGQFEKDVKNDSAILVMLKEYSEEEIKNYINWWESLSSYSKSFYPSAESRLNAYLNERDA